MKKIDQLIKNRKVIYALAALAAGILCAVAIFFIFFSNVNSIAGFFEGVTRVLAPIIIGLVLAYRPRRQVFRNQSLCQAQKRESAPYPLGSDRADTGADITYRLYRHLDP